MSAIDVGRQLTATNRRRTVATTKFGHLRLPDGSQRFPVPYVDALLLGIRSIINADNLRLFNNSPAAREALKRANTDLHTRLNEWLAESPQQGYLSIAALTWVLGSNPTRIVKWHKDSLVVSKRVDGTIYIHIADLLAKCNWVLPKK
jgi:hypothetical protein